MNVSGTLRAAWQWNARVGSVRIISWIKEMLRRARLEMLLENYSELWGTLILYKYFYLDKENVKRLLYNLLILLFAIIIIIVELGNRQRDAQSIIQLSKTPHSSMYVGNKFRRHRFRDRWCDNAWPADAPNYLAHGNANRGKSFIPRIVRSPNRRNTNRRSRDLLPFLS